MKTPTLSLLLVASFVFAAANLSHAQSESPKASKESQDNNPKYNAALAKELGADDFGMKSYVFVTLVTGKTVIKDEKERAKIFAGHFANMGRLAKEGKLVVAGPFVEGRPKRGMFIFNIESIKEAEKLVKSDPAVKAGVFDYEMTKLYCSAALLKINDIHETIQKKKVE